MPPLSPRRPVRSLSLLLHDRGWLIGFTTETAGWIVYVVALRLAPLSLVQAVSASGIAVLALLSVHGHPSLLARRERLAVGIALFGLVLLAVSLVGSTPSSHAPHAVAVVVWLGASAGAAVALVVVRTRLVRAAALGLAAGLLFADGDVSAKLVTSGGIWFLAILSLIAFYAAGTLCAAGSVPARQRADRRRHRHPGDERRPHRSRLRALRRIAAAGRAGSAADRRIRLRRRQCHAPRTLSRDTSELVDRARRAHARRRRH